MADAMLARLLDAALQTIDSHAAELDALDEAIGDGDHGTNMARAMRAVAAEKDAITALNLGAALQRIGEIVAREAGGNGGSMYAALFAGMGRTAPAAHPLEHLATMLEAGVGAVQAAGGAGKGDKTMLDVLIPVAQTVRSLVAEGRTGELGGRIVAAAGHGLHQTTNMQAKHGLAADLGPASINRLDPGACSAALLIGAIVGALEPAPATA